MDMTAIQCTQTVLKEGPELGIVVNLWWNGVMHRWQAHIRVVEWIRD